MAIISTGNNFGTTDAVTSTRLNNIANAATFVSGAVDGTSLELISGGSDDGKLGIKDAGITTAKIAAGALTNLVYPIGSIFTTVTNYANSAAVVNAIGGTTWTVFGAGRVLVGLNSSDTDFDTVEETGGAKTHTLGVTEIPPHKHTVQIESASSNVDGGGGTGVRPPLEARDTDEGNVGENSDGTGNASPHNNLQPYVVVYMWKRTA